MNLTSFQWGEGGGERERERERESVCGPEDEVRMNSTIDTL